ncbi:MAG: gliding motility-associated C-terminal domain-containing protein [Flagellimonas sp.]
MQTINTTYWRKQAPILVFLVGFQWICAQNALHNFGNLKIHKNTRVGFHTDLINNGPFQNNLGLIGFYGDESLEISGNSIPEFNDFEIMSENGIYLSNSVQINNNINFILGNMVTAKNTSLNSIGLVDEAFYIGTGDNSHVNGYVAAIDKELFTFPVGDGVRLRALTIASSQKNDLAQCAYFYEDPNNPVSLNQQFNTNIKESDELEISEIEFWKLESDLPSVVTLTWKEDSFANLFSENALNLVVVGWDKNSEKWKNLGNTAITGNLETGSITSDIFVPNNYEIITLGGNKRAFETLSISSNNYLLTPNNDGANDFLSITEIEKSPNNILNIYNRYGILVYSKINYNNEFEGISNMDTVFKRNAGLSSGVYFYFLTLKDINEKIQGYVYIAR